MYLMRTFMVIIAAMCCACMTPERAVIANDQDPRCKQDGGCVTITQQELAMVLKYAFGKGVEAALEQGCKAGGI